MLRWILNINSCSIFFAYSLRTYEKTYIFSKYVAIAATLFRMEKRKVWDMVKTTWSFTNNCDSVRLQLGDNKSSFWKKYEIVAQTKSTLI